MWLERPELGNNRRVVVDISSNKKFMETNCCDSGFCAPNASQSFIHPAAGVAAPHFAYMRRFVLEFFFLDFYRF